jgi:hypothetical protein
MRQANDGAGRPAGEERNNRELKDTHRQLVETAAEFGRWGRAEDRQPTSSHNGGNKC